MEIPYRHSGLNQLEIAEDGQEGSARFEIIRQALLVFGRTYARPGTSAQEAGRPHLLPAGLPEDPTEKRNLIADSPAKAAALELELRRFVAGLH
jgi:hypothetical protein